MDKCIGNSPPSPAETSEQLLVQDRLNAYLAEYKSLRSEIEWLIRDATQYQNFAIALIGAVITAIALVFDKAPTIILPILLVVPFIFCLLGFLFFRQHEEVYVIAAYLREYLRPQVRLLTKDNNLWGWEEFKARRSIIIPKAVFFKTLSTSKMILALRMLLFIIPSIFSLLTFTSYIAHKGIPQLVSAYGVSNIVLFIIGFSFDVLIILLLIAHLLAQGD